MAETRVKIQSIVESQLPDFVADEAPLLVDFLKQYYISQEYPSGSYDLIQNLDKYIKIDEIVKSAGSCVLDAAVSYTDTTITVQQGGQNLLPGTAGFPARYGILKINDEILTYTSKTDSTFENCVRGFSGVTSYSKPTRPEELVFSTSEVATHKKGAIVYNLSGLFLDEFLKKLKRQILPGFDGRELDTDLNQNLFIKQSKDFYSSKGTDRSFKILFGALYGENVEVIKPKDFLFAPSDAGYRRTKDLVVEKISGDPTGLLNNTLYQDSFPGYGISNSYASVTDVEKISIGGTDYYKLSFDSDFNKDLVLEGTVYGNFSVHPKSLVITPVSIGATVIDVDSTVGFAQSGELFATYGSGTTGIVSYTSKSITQFFGVTNVTSGIDTGAAIRLNVNAYGYAGIDTSDPITVRIGSVLDKVVIPEKTYLFNKDDTARIKSLGISSNTIRRDNWIDNIANSYDISTFTLRDLSNYTYSVTTYNIHHLRVGDNVEVTRSDSVKTQGTVVDVNGKYNFSITGQGELSSSYSYSVQKRLTKVTSVDYSFLNVNNANVQNTYTNHDDQTLVASPSLPFYYQTNLDPYDRKVVFSGTFSGEDIDIISSDSRNRGDHGFYTGDRVYYSPNVAITTAPDGAGGVIENQSVSELEGLEEGLYYVSRVNESKVRLAKSPSDLSEGDYISVSGIVTSNVLQDYNFTNKIIQPQNILREVKPPVNRSGNYVTEPGKVGVLVNGVEVLNYKSSETVFHGKIEDIEITAQGSGYDIINPPSLEISDAVGSGATGICAVKGSLDRIEILDTGFDYLDKPVITITGGNGKDAAAEANMRSIEHFASFNSEDTDSIGMGTDAIGFTSYHKFRDAEKVIYQSDGQAGLVGLTTGASYFARVIDALTIKLHIKENDAILGINTVNIAGLGTGIQDFKSATNKSIISDIVVTNTGEGYQNKQRTATIAGISTVLNTINIPSHGYAQGEELTYSTTGTVISGLLTTSNYLVNRVDNDSFKLAPVGLGTTSKTEYLDSYQYVEFASTGSGLHSFNYLPISVTVSGNIGVSTLANQDFSARVQPIFRGSIESVQLTASGSDYGSSDTLNYNRQPTAEFRSGKDAEVLPIVNNQKIVEVLVLRGGSGYNTPPDLEIKGAGKYAKLVPIIEGGQLKEVKILSGGSGYQKPPGGTLIEVKAAGKDCRIKANIQRWTVNLFRKYFENITPDDGIITTSAKEDGGLEYCHMYAPRKLREAVYVRLQEQEGVEDTILYGVADLRINNAEEQPSVYHSPIIGWAYDGNPIYGPYGYTTPTGGTARALKSGYEAVSPTNRPSSTNFPSGFFNEDFEFKNTGDLDEHNGRFGITPEYPNGVYAYFATINSAARNSSPPFQGFYEPSYPYVIGTSFYSQPNPFNFSKESDQDDYDLNNYRWFRNTTNYAFKKSNSAYDFVFNPDSLRHQTVNIQYASQGGVDSIGIVTGGNNYQVNDRLVFDNSGTGGSNASAKVSKVYGKNVSDISVATTSFSSVEFATLDGVGQVIGFTTAPHKLRDAEIVNVAGLNTAFSKLEGSYSLGIRSDNFVTTLGIGTTGTTGLTTYFYCSGLLDFPYIRENDILGIGTERVQVLNVEGSSGRIRVLRQFDDTTGVAHSSGTPLYEDPRKFRINSGFRTDYSYTVNREIYFDPHEAVGVGTSAIAGIGTTISFSTPGIGATQVFAPYQQIYLPNHGLKTGERVTYSTHGGSEIGVQLDGTKFALSQTQDLYAANISKNFVGISTVKVGLGTTGTFIGIGTTAGTGSGLLFFRDYGTGTNHSFKTKRTVISGEIGKNIVTVSTGSTHGLRAGNSVDFSCVPIDGEDITVKYDDNNRRATFISKTFVAGDVDTSEDTISITNHRLSTGDKVIYTASTVIGGMVNENMYYVLYYTKDKIRLCKNRYDLSLNLPKYVDFTSTSGGTLSLVNPLLKIYRNKIAKFNLGDSSLASVVGVNTYSAFELNFYRDSEYKYKFDSTSTSNTFQVTRTGQVGIDTNAITSLILNDDVPEILYYKLDVVNKNLVAEVKTQIVIDTDVTDNNQINLVDSKYSGTHRLTGIGTTSFKYDLEEYPEAASYTKSIADLYYTTNSTTAFGPISKVEVLGSGTKYSHTPGITTVSSTFGKNALLDVNTTSIGKIIKDKVEDIGFDYPSDFTLSPSLNLPEVVKINPLASFSHVGITSAGKDYLTPPGLVVLDGYTGKVVDDVILRYEIGETTVKIHKNTFGMYDVEPTIIPINNSNGVGINSFSYDSTYKRVTVGFNTGFSDAFPFAVGDTVLIENISVGIASTARGYNSDAYNYKLFPIVAVSPQLGGDQGNITYDMSDVLAPNEYPGAYNALQSRGRAIPTRDFPIFDIQLKKNDFMLGERVTTGDQEGIVESWNNKTEFLKVSTDKDFKKGAILTGETSNTKGEIINRVDFDAHVNVGPTASVNKGWRYDTGMLNNNVQRLPDNDYYQQFSYSLKSKVPFETWDNPVSSLNHTSGFLKFSDLIIETQESNFVRDNNSLDSDTTATVDFTGFGNLHCVSVFDLASENNSRLPAGGIVSNEIVFENRVLTDFYESIGNRVLTIDDFSNTFSHKPRATRYGEVNRFDLTASRTKKYFTYVRDTRYTAERQLLIVSLLHDGVRGYLNQYARVETHPDLGSFDFVLDGSDGTLDFYPIKYKKNNYDITYISHDLTSEVAGIGSTALGDFVHINSHQVTATGGSSTALTIVGIASTYRSAKVLVEIGAADNSYFEFDELNVIHDGSTVDLVEYGQLTDHNVSSFGIGGLGTYYSYIDGTRLKIDWTPDSALGVAHTINSMSISIASSTTTATGVGTYQLNTGTLDTWYTSISRAASPGITTIAEFDNEDSSGDSLDGAAYYIVQVEDSTNDRYEMSEVVVCTDQTDDGTVWTEYGNAQMHTSGLGTIGVGQMPNSAERTSLHFTPNANIDVQVRVFQNSVGLFQDGLDKDQINLENALIRANRGTYEGTETSIKRAFGLLHDNKPIFQRYFVGSASTIVDLTNNTISIPDHFFVTGEELRYSYSGAGSTSAIGIASTVVTGIGTTDKMPESVYAIVNDNKTIQLAKSATDALAAVTVPLDFTSVGVGTSHCFISRNPNAKALVALDNFIQSPIVGTSLTTTLSKNVTVNDIKVTFSGITSFRGGDLVKINSEIMKINTVGVGSTNIILMDREWLGTGIGTHSSGDLVTLIEGNYNIVDNVLNFVEAPYGLEPISSTTNAPDDRDWVGIATHSTFQGRTFMRSGVEDAADATYSTNFVLDDISGQFTGVAKTFTLTSDKSNISGIATGNAVILVNGIFQGPPSDDGETEDYELGESVGITSITFTGTATSVTYDVNNANIPVGGVIVSLGSTEGFGLQPLVAAGATPVISAAGTVQSISIGNSGSGYRIGIQTTVNVAIQTSSLYAANYTGIGTAQITDGHITGVAITNPHVFHVPANVSNVGYSSITGITTITTVTDHGLQRGEAINLSGIAFTCDYAAPISISTAAYTSTTGIMTVTTTGAHGFSTTGKSSVVIFTGLAFTCGLDAGVSTHFYPRGQDYAYDNAVSIASSTTNTVTVNVGVAGPGDQYAHTFKRASTNALVSGGDYLHSFVSGVTSCVVSGGNYLHTFDSVGVTSITVTGIGSTVPTDATYAPLTGELVLTVGSGHTYTTSDTVGIGTSALVFTCAMDQDGTTHSYPRADDPVAGVNTAITAITDSTITVNVGTSRSVFFDVYDAQYTGSTGIMTLNIGSHTLKTGKSIRLMNEGLSFRCAMDSNKTIHKYPRSTDPYYDTAISIAATTANTIALNVGITSLVYNDVSAATYDPTTGDLVLTVGSGHSLNTGTKIKIAESSLTFTCARDAHASEHSYPRRPDPMYGGVPVSTVGVGTTTFTVQVGISTVPTYYQGGGTVQAAIVAPRAKNFSTSGTDAASPGVAVESVVDSKTIIVNTGVSTRTHFYARGGKIEKNLDVKFDDPLSYSDVALIYSSESTQGIGTWATADVVVGQGSSVIDFAITNTGYGFGEGEILTVDIGGTAGIPTDTSLTYKEFQLTIQEIYKDSFSGWSMGDFQVLDDWDELVDGVTRKYPLKSNGEYLTIRAGRGSNISVKDCLLIFVNDVLQKPGEAYVFEGGSVVTFSEPLRSGDTTKVIFYKGTGDVDVVFKDILETVKVGDELTLNYDIGLGQGAWLQEEERVVTGIVTTDTVQTNPYSGPGITTDDTFLRPIEWCRQTHDKIINGALISKARPHYEPNIFPSTLVIQSVGVGSTYCFVESLKPFFDAADEDNTSKNTYTVEIVSQDVKTSAAATATVSTAGTISSFTVTDAGYGYVSAPTVSVANPTGLGTYRDVGIGTTHRATGIATIGSGIVTSITVSTQGMGYTSTNPPLVLVGDSIPVRNVVTKATYTGDFGDIIGIRADSVGVASTALVFDLMIPPDSFLRDSEYVSGVSTVSGIQTGYFFTVSNSNIGGGVTSLYSDGSNLGIGTSYLDNVYEVAAVGIATTLAATIGYGVTAVAQVTVSVASTNGVTGFGQSNFYGNYSWGRVVFGARPNTSGSTFNAYTNDGVTGLTTSAILRRLYPLKSKNYN